MTEDTEQRQRTGADRETAVDRAGNVAGRLFSGVLTKVIILVVIVLVGVYALVAKLENLNPFGSRTTISTTVVLGKLTKIEQLHVATRSYPVDVSITQSVGIIPCFLICNQMELKGSGTDDAIADLSKLTSKDVSINQSAKTVTVKMAPPVIGPAELDPVTATITSSHGVVNTLTAAFRSNPNGYRPLYAAAETQIHRAAAHDQDLMAAGEQSIRATLTRLLGAVGVKKVTVTFG
jgi:hypothetical protein